MRVIARPLAPGELDSELLCLAISLGGVTLAATWFALHLPWPICAFHALTGHPCATCGATRSAIAFFHGDFVRSWSWNPLMFVFYTSLSAFNVYAAVALVSRSRRVRLLLNPREKTMLRRTAVCLFALNWVYLLIANPPL